MGIFRRAGLLCLWAPVLACQGEVLDDQRGAPEPGLPSDTPPLPPPREEPEGPTPPPTDADALHAAMLEMLGSGEVRCASCHDGAQLNLASGSITDFANRLVGRPSRSVDCAGELLVDPERPERSLILQLIDANRSEPACLASMPLGTSGVSEADFARFERWIDALIAAHEGAPVASAPVRSDVAVPARPFDVLNNTKYLIDGRAVTADELASAQDAQGRLDQEAFEGLVQTWLDGENFNAKRWRFFELALQQNPASSRYVQQLRNTVGVNAQRLVDSLEQSWIRTAERIYREQRDFRSVFYTTRQEVTTSMLLMLAMTDNPNLRNHLGRAKKGIEINDARATLSSNYSGDDGALFASDLSDWRTVELRFDPNSTAMRDNAGFADGSVAAALRAVSEGGFVTLRTPRTLCSSLPFFQMWQTNRDNRFRALVNQCLIVTLGETFATADPTSPAVHPLPGLRAQEVGSDPECMGCHKNLDPMLSAFEAHFDYEHQRFRPHSQEAADFYVNSAAAYFGYTPGARGLGLFYAYEPFPEPYFSFRGANTPGTDLLSVVRSIATHPDFAMGWAMKVCQWASSVRCDKSDPELQRIARDFSDSGFRLDRLFQAFFSSKLTTHTYGEATSYPGAQVSVSRRAHYCHALDVRLQEVRRLRGLNSGTSSTDICGNNQKLSEAVPEGNSVRGAVDFNLPRSSSAFSSISISNMCSANLGTLIARGNSRTFDRDGAQQTIALMVEQMLGFPPGTQMHADAMDALSRIFAVFSDASLSTCANEAEIEAALSTTTPTCGLGLSNQDAMENVFSLVCQSPALTALGL